MMDLLDQFEKEFKKMREELGFSASLDELDTVFHLRDFIQQVGFVSTSLDRMLSGRIRDTFSSWIGYLHGLAMPNPGYMPAAEEASLFENQREEIFVLMRKYIALSNENAIIGLEQDKKRQAEFFDEALALWNETKPQLLKYLQRTHTHWRSLS